MYDFYFGEDPDPKKYLLTIKRMLPRWCNSIPDSEYLAIYDILNDMKLDRPVFVETGSGASSIVLAYFALLSGGELYTWDTNGSKLAFLRGVINDTLMRKFTSQNLTNHWKCVACSSTSLDVGIGILGELDKKVRFSFHDSEHTLETLLNEVTAICKIMDDGVVAIDDGNYQYMYHNLAYINMMRKKLGLFPTERAFNESRCFWVEIEELLNEWFEVAHIQDTYKQTYKTDLFWSYYRNDRDVMKGLDMEKDGLEHRFDAWEVKR